MRRLFLIAALLVVPAACNSPSSASSAPESPKKKAHKPGKTIDPGPPVHEKSSSASASASASSQPDDGPPHLVEQDTTITHFDDKATLHVWIPSGFVDHHNGEFQAPAKSSDSNSYGQSILAFDFGGYSCTGGCKDADYERELHDLVAHVKEHAEKPNLNTGDPKLDAVRLNVTELEKGKIPDGEYIAIRVMRPQGLDAPDSVDELHAVCSRHRKGDDFYFYASATVRTTMFPKDEATLWPLLLEACKKAEAKDGKKIQP